MREGLDILGLNSRAMQVTVLGLEQQQQQQSREWKIQWERWESSAYQPYVQMSQDVLAGISKRLAKCPT